MRYLIIILFFISTSLIGQTNTQKKYRATLSIATNDILNKLDSLMCDTLANCQGKLESPTIGEGNEVSILYLQYAELIKVATEKELLKILDNQSELSAIRGYALMAYIYDCEKKKKPEKHFNYKFQTFAQIGCVGRTYSFEELNHKVRRFYDPNPRYFFKDPEEQEVIKQENKIRKEQGIPLRKD